MAAEAGGLSPSRFGRPDLDRAGVFIEGPYIHDPDAGAGASDAAAARAAHSASDPIGTRYRGRQLLGAAGNEPFTKGFARAFDGEPYQDPTALRRAWRAEQTRDALAGPFRPASYAQRASGKGSLFGTIEREYPTLERRAFLPGGAPEPRDPAARRRQLAEQPRVAPFVVRLGRKEPLQSIAYPSEPYDALRVKAREEREAAAARFVAGKAFNTMRSGPFFGKFERLAVLDAGGAGGGGGEGPSDPRAKRAAAASQSKGNAGTRQKGEPLVQAPFKPSSRRDPALGKYPSHSHLHGAGSSASLADEAAGEPKKTYAPFRPVGISKQGYTKSIIAATASRTPPVWFHARMARATRS
ncbi:hypothetical protein CXG81DRAFT_18423 [Caulochytrium protostelioides]|uniref:Cilia-and flagella-associated protein 96 n=1 Tax=Caulochytrium protostelioides TaxID=1555241 RepID=A0A4P9XA02_9FUNG|nr:hypothetical protein CXG81DRAFT_18423 [Caulochytrium protostelioides]|eukprot:RKP01861.1 hypothetical protein CXG81DRAFT_18423 [Caulochytrium protostelioides]